MSNLSSIHQLEISFETLSIPPPYSHAYAFTLTFDANELYLQYNLEYTGRDELSKEEIWEEGFSDNDNFKWEGHLPPVWRNTLLAAWKGTHLVSEEKYAEPLQNGLFIAATLVDGQQTSGIPDELEDWEYLLQELTQAVYEAAQREYPLRIRYVEWFSQKAELQLVITIHFRERSLKIIRQQEQQQRERNLPWAEVKPLMSTLYQLDFNTPEAQTKMPTRPGKYLDPGDGLWYQLGKDIANPGKKDYLSQWENIILRAKK
ncbi:hypothetical protein [Tunicatimonas pelagia]|uniref:hypothetical protein n=1 Tax=Tunicatimonas pelagia TaxID=931531 RepID=UPI0026669250|nr:hypothetical protein [Tunicatimonas pelagia]WKN40449.1 hypothetical protein P0M28_15500 [Tunicatimonas pelagia]